MQPQNRSRKQGPSKDKTPTKKTYRIRVPVTETWHFTVEAYSGEDAFKRYKNHDETLEQECSTGGSTSSGKIEIEEV